MKSIFFLSAACLSAAFVLGGIVTFAWPLPAEVWETYSNPTADALGFAYLLLGIVGLVTFVVGWWQEKNK